MRCPACKTAFTVEQPAQTGPTFVFNEADTDQENPLPEATDANELSRVKPPPPPAAKAKITTSFSQPQQFVFKVAVQTLRGTACTITALDWANCHAKFTLPVVAGPPGEHDLFAIETPAGGCDVDISSKEPNGDGTYDSYYQALVREMGKYLMFAAPAPPPIVPPPPAPMFELPPARTPARRDRDYDDDDDDDDLDYRRRRYRERSGGSGLGVAGFVCGLVGTVLFCIPWLGGILGVLGVILGGVSMAQKKRKNGLGIAGFTLGIIACVLALLWVVAIADASRRRY